MVLKPEKNLKKGIHIYEGQTIMNTCEVCKKKYPWYVLSKVFIYSREYCGDVLVCDFCYVDSNGKKLRKHSGLIGWIYKKVMAKKETNKNRGY